MSNDVGDVCADEANGSISGSLGSLYSFANTELTFAVTGTDSPGENVEGDIVISI